MDEIIKKFLKKFTDDFSQEDIDFIKGLEYPHKIQIEDLETHDIYTSLLEQASDLLKYKSFPQNMKLTIKNDDQTMVIISREAQENKSLSETR